MNVLLCCKIRCQNLSMGRCPTIPFKPFLKKGLKNPKNFDKRKTAFFSGVSEDSD